MKKKIVILLGPPGSGKGTQAGRLAKGMGLPHISTGDLFRENMREKTPLGLKAQKFIDEGKLVPDQLVLEMLNERVARGDCKLGYILDGFPRTIPQAEALDIKLDDDDEVHVLNLQVKDSVIVERITGRLICKNCGHIMHRTYNPPRKEGLCDNCGGELYQRSDDTEEVVKTRLDAYKTQTEPLIAYYEGKGLLKNIEGENKPDEVFSQLFDALRIS